MAILEGTDGVSALSVDDLLNKDLCVPYYQRPYSWTPETALQLVSDIIGAFSESKKNIPYVLGAVILHCHDKVFDVVDGQQRLLTLTMILRILNPGSADSAASFSDGKTPVSRAWLALSQRLKVLSRDVSDSLSGFIHTECQFICIVTNDVDEAFRVFDSQNYRGKPLSPHDLLKAHHLREMVSESPAMKVAVVETWESVLDTDLDRLFSIYLYRIARWSRGESAPKFTSHDIGVFKGVSPKSTLPPSARYHLAAQMALPMLGSLGAWSELDVRDAKRSCFQLDAPIMAGRLFFEMVAFMLGELKQLAQESFAGEAGDFALYDVERLRDTGALKEIPSRSRYRYVSELYLAALLYYTNKFGDEDIAAPRTQLFAWAYAPRAELLRVQFQTIDNRARGEASPSAFRLLRNAVSSGAIFQLPTSVQVPAGHDDHEKKLVDFLRSGGAVQ